MRWLQIPAAADYAAVSRDTIYTACGAGQLNTHAWEDDEQSACVADWIDAWLQQPRARPGKWQAVQRRW